jgi:hypothetical protein
VSVPPRGASRAAAPWRTISAEPRRPARSAAIASACRAESASPPATQLAASAEKASRSASGSTAAAAARSAAAAPPRGEPGAAAAPQRGGRGGEAAERGGRGGDAPPLEHADAAEGDREVAARGSGRNRYTCAESAALAAILAEAARRTVRERNRPHGAPAMSAHLAPAGAAIALIVLASALGCVPREARAAAPKHFLRRSF